MVLLNEQTFTEMLTRCYENVEYQGAIMLESEAKKIEFVEELLRVHNDNPITGVREIVARTPHTYIEFENESEIEIITPHDLRRMREHQFNEALLDADILDFDVIDVLERSIEEYTEAVARERVYRHRRRTFADIVMGRGYTDESTATFNTYAMGQWGAHDNADVEINIDKQSKETLDDFLKSFTQNGTFQSGA